MAHAIPLAVLPSRHDKRAARAGRFFALLVAIASFALITVAFAQPAAAYYPVPVNTTAASIDGVPVVGSVLSANPGAWVSQPPLFFSYSWSSPAHSDLSDTQAYTVAASDVGQVLSVQIIAMDGNNNTTTVVVKTPPITRSDVVSKVAPRITGGLAVGDTAKLDRGTFTSGSGALTYTYAWSRTDGKTSTPLSDTGLTHRITTADLGFYLSVAITARSTTQQAGASARSKGVTIPAVPVSSDTALTASNRGQLTQKTTKADAAAGTTTITDPAGTKGDGVFVYGYSAPTSLGWFSLGASKQFTVSYLTLTPGAHKLVVIDQAGKVIGWVAVTRPPQQGSLSGTANPIIAIAAVVVVLGIIAVIVGTQLRRRKPRH